MIRIIAHRGNGPTSILSGNGKVVPSHLHPENTLRSFRWAIEEGADGIELDVCFTKDKQLVVIHDDLLNKNVEGANRNQANLGRISQKTISEIKRFNVGQGEAIPSLEEVFELCSEMNSNRVSVGKPPLILNIELKYGAIAAVEPLIKLVEAYSSKLISTDDLVCCSFNHFALRKLKKLNSNFQISPSLYSRFLYFTWNAQFRHMKSKQGAAYHALALPYLEWFHKNYRCAAIDPFLWDIYQPLITFAKTAGIEIHTTASDIRSYDQQLLRYIVCLAQEVSVSFKTDEPRLAHDALSFTKKHFSAVYDPNNSHTTNLMKISFEACSRELLKRPISIRPETYSSSLQKQCRPNPAAGSPSLF